MPLIGWTIKAALGSRNVSRTIVSTNDPRISSIAEEFGAEVPFKRPESLADCGTHSVFTILHALEELKIREGYSPDVILMLLPTSPFRSSEDIDNCIDLFNSERYDSVISVTLSDKQLVHMRVLKDGFLTPIQKFETLNMQRQTADDLYVLNGSIYVTSPKSLLEEKTFHMSFAKPYLMPPERSVDINTQRDLDYAQMLLGKQKGIDL